MLASGPPALPAAVQGDLRGVQQTTDGWIRNSMRRARRGCDGCRGTTWFTTTALIWSASLKASLQSALWLEIKHWRVSERFNVYSNLVDSFIFSLFNIYYMILMSIFFLVTLQYLDSLKIKKEADYVVDWSLVCHCVCARVLVMRTLVVNVTIKEK